MEFISNHGASFRKTQTTFVSITLLLMYNNKVGMCKLYHMQLSDLHFSKTL